MMLGYFGRYLRVDLVHGATPVAIAEETLRSLIGGVGLGTALLMRETRARFDPLGPDACVVFAFSPFVGTSITTSAKLAVVSKSPLTGRLNDALSSSDFAIAGKRSGHDAIVLRGRAEEPSVVLIDGERVRIERCADLWGTGESVSSVDATLSKRYPGYHFAVIGVAGENLVRYAGICNGGRHAGRGGLGAVLGAMRIKAVGVRGKQPVTVADPKRLVDIARDLARRSLGPATEKYRELGTIANLAAFNRLAALPTKNFQESTFEGAEALSGETLTRTRALGKSSCRTCTIGCEHFFAAPGGKRVKLEYESLFALGPLCGIDDPDVTLAAALRCDELGLDTISAGGTIAFAMECNERGLLSHPDLRFGNGQALLAMLDDIAHGKSELGRLLQQGSRAAAERIGPPAPDFAPHVKGLEIPGYEPRALQTMALGFAVGSRGADHNKSGAYEVDFSERVDRFAPSLEAVAMAVDTENRAALIDSLILCKFLRGVFDDLYVEAAEALNAITGVPFDAAELRAVAERIVLMKKLFNLREGWTRDEDRLPRRFTSEALEQGVARGAIVDETRLDALIEAYYEARGWRRDGTVPEQTIAQSGL
ncbi:MAG TPA: aldehyde ferredoxin oxidoreductase family protein [Polyangiaceae bacterium]|jgi:aldehyde:ferredoxin oxidoreductase|nr:aldehyde ferredoxin oxidoreductase family protein [Polyangiaceae bacterium]